MRLGQVAGVTDTGRKRRRNEDAYVREPPLFAVADGMGGAQAGEVASRLAAAALREDAHPTGGEERVAALIQEANRRVYQRSSEDAAASGMGTTMTVALVEDGIVAIGHVGDSRAYLIRDRRLEQLTEDHSLVAELVRSGKLSPEEAETHPQRSVITRALGTDPDVDVDTFSIAAQAGDVFLLCSDGLTSMVGDNDILSIVERHRDDLKAAATELIQEANRGGGEDNITVVFFEIEEGGGDGGGGLAETKKMPAVDGEGPESVDEDTLSGLEAVPPVDTMVVPPERVDEWLARGEAEQAATAEPEPEPPPRRRGRRLLLAVVALALVAVLATLVVWLLSRSHFVGAEPDGYVAVYQGVPWDVVGGVKLYRPVYVSNLRAAQLTRPERQRLFDHSLVGYGTARSEVRQYEEALAP